MTQRFKSDRIRSAIANYIYLELACNRCAACNCYLILIVVLFLCVDLSFSLAIRLSVRRSRTCMQRCVRRVTVVHDETMCRVCARECENRCDGWMDSGAAGGGAIGRSKRGAGRKRGRNVKQLLLAILARALDDPIERLIDVDDILATDRIIADVSIDECVQL